MKKLVLLMGLLVASPAFAAAKDGAPRQIGSFGYWRAYTTAESGQPVCYMTLTARFPASKTFRRSDALLTITHRPVENSKDVISYTAGYNYKTDSSADLRIGKQSFNLFTAGDTAWSRDALTDHKIAAAILTAPSLSIRGIRAAKNAAPLTDHFSLKGAPEAYRAIGKACGVTSDNKAAPGLPLKPKKKQ